MRRTLHPFCYQANTMPLPKATVQLFIAAVTNMTVAVMAIDMPVEDFCTTESG